MMMIYLNGIKVYREHSEHRITIHGARPHVSMLYLITTELFYIKERQTLSRMHSLKHTSVIGVTVSVHI